MQQADLLEFIDKDPFRGESYETRHVAYNLWIAEEEPRRLIAEIADIGHEPWSDLGMSQD